MNLLKLYKVINKVTYFLPLFLLFNSNTSNNKIPIIKFSYDLTYTKEAKDKILNYEILSLTEYTTSKEVRIKVPYSDAIKPTLDGISMIQEIHQRNFKCTIVNTFNSIIFVKESIEEIIDSNSTKASKLTKKGILNFVKFGKTWINPNYLNEFNPDYLNTNQLTKEEFYEKHVTLKYLKGQFENHLYIDKDKYYNLAQSINEIQKWRFEFSEELIALNQDLSTYTSDIKDELKISLFYNQIEKALYYLKDYCEKNEDQENLNKVIIASSNYHDLQNKIRREVISLEEEKKYRIEILENLIHIIDNL